LLSSKHGRHHPTAGHRFHRKRLYRFCLKYLAPVCLVIILLSSIANVLGWISL